MGVTRRVGWAGGLPGGGERARCPLQAALRCSCILCGPSSVFLPSHCSLGPSPGAEGFSVPTPAALGFYQALG